VKNAHKALTRIEFHTLIVAANEVQQSAPELLPWIDGGDWGLIAAQ
jgi:hypothetical protein